MKKKIIVATRPSLLAYTQTKQTVELLKELYPDLLFEIKKISTQGDRNRTSSLTQFGGTGVFVKELEQTLLNEEADIAVHSLKDMPAVQPSGLVLAAFPKREDPRDIFLSESDNVSIVGTGSPRRLLQCAIKYPSVSFVEIRGNIETRLQKLSEGYCDATYLAAAGLNRLGLEPQCKAIRLEVEEFIPAIGQGALAIQCRVDDRDMQNMLQSVSDLDTEIAVKAERAFMKEIEGGCKFPLAAHAYMKKGKLQFLAIVGDLKTLKYVKESVLFSVEDNVEKQAVLVAQKMLKHCKKEQINLSFQ